MQRTALAFHDAGGTKVEAIAGGQSCWRFRPHFHAGDEVVRILAGRARLRLGSSSAELGQGDTIVVPAGAIHRFEPVDEKGWAFSSEFMPRPAQAQGQGCSDAESDGLVRQVKLLLAERPALRTQVEAIAKACAVSSGHLARTFRRATGTGLHNFQVLLAVRKAKALLQEGAPPAEAALDGGFYDQAHLNREFVRTFGMTPGTFRSAWAAH
ncbi:MAG: helix-turn-helix domain-containing protein [Alphaproteobacteria bacterium]|nr:helix-turn-helix domain-containing protein [Alphaproteobacteria bacterium]MBV8409962.1 helix-turn-helix domain-containing protein [Alphaproteobacteria bacterium]